MELFYFLIQYFTKYVRFFSCIITPLGPTCMTMCLGNKGAQDLTGMLARAKHPLLPPWQKEFMILVALVHLFVDNIYPKVMNGLG